MVAHDILQSEKRVTFVYEKETKIVGYLILHSEKSFQDDNGSAEFEMCIHPNYRKKGTATKLLEHALSYAKEETNLKCIKLGLSKDNIKIKKLQQ